MQELDFDVEACFERWTEWYHFESDGDSAACCKMYELNDPIHIKIIKHGYVDIDVTLPVSDF